MSDTYAVTTAAPSVLAPAPRAEASPQERRIIAVTSVAHTLCHVSELAFAGVLLALKAEFDLSRDEVTLLGVPGFVLLGVGAVPTGLATDRWGARPVLLLYFFWIAASALAVVLAPGVWTIGLALTSLGAAASLYHPAGLAMISHGCRLRGRALGINGVAGSIGVASGPALGMILAGLGHWRLMYVLIAVAGLASGLVLLLLRIDETAVLPVPTNEGDTPPAETETQWRGLWLLFAAMMLGGLNYRCLLTALPTWLEKESGSSLMVLGGSLTFLVLILGGIGQYVGGQRADRVSPVRFYASLIAVTVPLALLMAHAAPLLAVAAAAALATVMFGQQPVENTVLAQVTARRSRSTFYGLKFALTFGVGGLGAQLVGFIWQETGSLAPAFDVFAISASLMALCAIGFDRVRSPKPC